MSGMIMMEEEAGLLGKSWGGRKMGQVGLGAGSASSNRSRTTGKVWGQFV